MNQNRGESKQIYKNNILNTEYKNIKNQKYLVELEKDEMIRFYAEKIIYDCITDCSENNRVFCVDEYKNNSFLIDNFDKIVEKINKDERICDLEVDTEKKELDFIFYTEYCPHYYQEDLDISNNDKYDYIKEFANYIFQYSTMNLPKWFRTNTRALIRNFIDQRCPPNVDRDLVDDLLKKELNESGFVDKYLDGYTVYVGLDNLNELVECLENAKENIKLMLEDGEIENE